MESAKILFVIFLFLASIWVFPESMQRQCLDYYHQEYLSELARIEKLALDGKIKRELRLIMLDRYIEQVEDVCGVQNEKAMVQK